MKRYLWILLLAACSAPTGEVANTAKTIEDTAAVQNSQEGAKELSSEIVETGVTKPERLTPDVKVVPPIPGPESTVTATTVEKKTLEGTYFGIRELDTINEINIEDDNEDDMPNDRRLVLVFDKEGKAGWGDADDENTAKSTANGKQYTYEVDGNTVTVKKGDGNKLLVLELRDDNKFIYITQDNTDKIPQLKTGVKYEKTGLALGGVEVKNSGHGGLASTRVTPRIPPFEKK